MNQKKLYRSKIDRMLGGVCGGLAEYLGLDPSIVRLIFVLVSIFGENGVLIYIILWIIVPENPGEMNKDSKSITSKTMDISDPPDHKS